MLRHYNANLGGNYLDIGPGTGWYLQHAAFPVPNPRIALLDLNPQSLQTAAESIRQYAPTLMNADIFTPIPNLEPFDSVATNYVFHCIPGDWTRKALAVQNIAAALTPEGTLMRLPHQAHRALTQLGRVLLRRRPLRLRFGHDLHPSVGISPALNPARFTFFGATVLGRGVRHNMLGRLTMRKFNQAGIFHNLEDDQAGLENALTDHFAQVEIRMTGTVALFSASKPLRKD